MSATATARNTPRPKAGKSPRTLVKCSMTTAKALVFLTTFLLVMLFTALFRLAEANSPLRPFFLLGVICSCILACVFATLFGSYDCSRTSVELRRSRELVVFSVKLPLEKHATRDQMLYLEANKDLVMEYRPPPCKDNEIVIMPGSCPPSYESLYAAAAGNTSTAPFPPRSESHHDDEVVDIHDII